jgi:hypothetical protein
MISAVCALKNRMFMLKVSLMSWLNFKEIEEIVIVNWDSKDVSFQDFENLKSIDSRIKIINEKNKNYFNLSKSYNLAVKNAKGDKIIKLDVDYILNPYFNFFEKNSLNQGEFITGDWQMYPIDNGAGFITYLNGFVYLHKKDFIDVGGYNRNLKDYGWDDADLYERLQKKGLKRKKILIEEEIYIYHNPHNDYHRSENYECKDIKKSAEKNEHINSKL